MTLVPWIESGMEQPTGSRPGRTATWILRALLRFPALTYAVSTVLATIVVFFWTYTRPPVGTHPSIAHIVSQNAGGVVISIILGLLFEPAVIILCLYKTVFLMIRIARASAGKGRKPVLPFMSDTLDRMNNQLTELHEEGALLEPYEVANWVRRCFQTAQGGTYVGTDSHIPSDYEDIYTDYLLAHSAFIEGNASARSTRIMLVEMERLRFDRSDHTKSYNFFRKWHDDRPTVSLKQIEPTANEHLIAELQLGSLNNTDVGFWDGDFVLLFNPVKEGNREKVRLRLSYKGGQLYEQCQRYLAALQSRTQDLGVELPFYPESLSETWHLFCNPAERIRHVGPFIDSILARIPRSHDEIRIFDAATGIGIETVYLLKADYFVTTNEIENSLRTKANEYAQSQGVRINPAQFTNSDWLNLEADHGAGQYDAVLVMGNSLCHLVGPKQLEDAFRQFRRLLRAGGVLVCDERNFGYIVEKWQDIQSDPWNNFRFNNRSDKVMYYGDQVLGAPTAKGSNNRIIFEYRHVTDEGTGGNRRHVPRDEVLGTLSMYAFKAGEMRRILAQSDLEFDTVEIFSDLKFSGDRFDSNADFYTYAAWVSPGPSERADGALRDDGPSVVQEITSHSSSRAG